MQNYRLISGYAMEYGTFLGVCWIAVFALYVLGLRTLCMPAMLLAFLAFLALPLPAFALARRFRGKLPEEQPLGYGSAYVFALMMLVDASLLTAAAEFCYFEFIDKGALVQQLSSLVTNFTKAYGEQSLPPTIQGDSLDLLAQPPPLDITVALLNQNIFTAFILAIPTAVFAWKRTLTNQP